MEFYNKTKGINTLTKKYDYIKNHFTYYTLNSWNGLTSIANNMKLYNLGIKSEQLEKAFNIISFDDFWFEVNCIIEDSGLKVGFNGRSGGYLVLYDDESNGNALSNDYEPANYKEFIEELKDCYNYNHRDAQADAKNTIEKDFELVKDFDILCDNIRSLLLYYIDNASIIDEEVTTTATIKKLVIN